MGWKLKRPAGVRRPQPTPRLLRHDAEGLYNKVLLHLLAGHFHEAESLLRQAKGRWPRDPRIDVYYARLRQLRDDDHSPAVWRGLRWSWATWERATRFAQPRWDGTPMPGGTLLVWGAGYGLGDWFMLSRLLPATKAQSQATLLLLPPTGLGPVLAGLCDGWVEAPLAPDVAIDAQIPLNWVPVHIPLTPERMANTPYLTPDPAAVTRWAPLFADRSVLHVGLHWQADPSHDTGPKRSTTLADLAPLFETPGVRWYSLQFGGSAEVRDYPAVIDLGAVDARDAKFVESAAIISLLDLMITVDSSVTHLAGALNTPTWLLLGFVYDPQWGYRRRETVWYRSHRVFHQRGPDHGWGEVIEEVRGELGWVLRELFSPEGRR